jgi:hypothetical protein
MYQILAVVMGVIFIISTNGILIFKTNCVCTGNEQVSLYVAPETCEEEFHVHHTHNHSGCAIETSEHNCHECSSGHDECGCEAPEVEFIKLINQISEDEYSFLKVQQETINIFVAALLQSFENEFETGAPEFYADPPPKHASSKHFLIEVNQLKIPHSA